ncbi:MAG: dockerin type I domain-containing protein, partial [Phycisphaerae bacterium]
DNLQVVNNTAAYVRNIAFDGGLGFNTVLVDDRSNFSAPWAAILTPSSITRDSGPSAAPNQDILSFSNIGSFTYYADATAITTTILGAPAVAAGQQSTLYLGNNNDAVTIIPHDTAGNLTMNSNIGILGGAGTDTLTIDDTASALGINYRLYNPYGASTADISGLGTGLVGILNDFESLVIKAGSGNDTFNIDSFQTGNALSIYGNGGVNTLDVTPTGQSLSAGITSISYFLFDGTNGYSIFNLNNQNAAVSTQWTYMVHDGSVYASKSGYNMTFTLAAVAAVNLYGGSGTDQFTVHATSAGQTVALYADQGNDTFLLGNMASGWDVSGIKGLVEVFGKVGNSGLLVDDQLATTGKILHIDTNTIGAYLGDTLFGPGGSLYFTGITGSTTIRLGSGPDTVYAKPNPNTPLFIYGNDPTTPDPGDVLNLAFAAAVNPVFHDFGAAGQSYTFDNGPGLAYFGFEQVNIDAVAPTILSAVFNYDLPQQSIIVQFSKDVSQQLNSSYLVLTNTTTATQVPYADIAMAYDHATNTATFTFPNYLYQALPNGVYHLDFVAGLPDLFGNALVAGTTLDFFVLAGDADRDGQVTAADFAQIDASWLQVQGGTANSGFTWLRGDFDYDGQITANDFAIIDNAFTTQPG